MDDNNQKNQVSDQELSQPMSVPPMAPLSPLPTPQTTTIATTIENSLPVASDLPPAPLPPQEPVAEELPRSPFTSMEQPATQTTNTVTTTEELLPTKKKNKVIPAILAVVAVLLVGGIAGASYFVSNRLSQQAAVAPNAPESQPQAGCPSSCSAAGCSYQQVCKQTSGGCYYCEAAGGQCPAQQIFCGGCIDGCRPANQTCNTHIANECGSSSSSGGGGDCFSNGCQNGTCCLCSNGRDPATGNCRGGSAASYCGNCSDPGADWIKCGTQQCDPGSQECCPNGCFAKGSNCGGSSGGGNNEACYYDTKGDVNGKQVAAGSSIRIAGWGGICRNSAMVANQRVDVHICNKDGSNCSGLKGTIKRNDRSESPSQTDLCKSGVPGKPNTLGFDDTVTIPSTITPGEKVIKVVVVAPNPAGGQFTKWCQEPIFTLTPAPLVCDSWTSMWINDCTPQSEFDKTPRSSKCTTTSDSVTLHMNNPKATQMRFRTAKSAATLCTDTNDANFNAWSAWETYATTKTYSISAAGSFTGTQLKVCGQFKDATTTSVSCGGIIDKTSAPACVAAQVAYKAGSVWTKITNDQIADKVKSGDTVRLYATGNSAATKVHFRVTQPDGTKLFSPEWKDGVLEGSAYFVEFAITKAGSYTFEAEVQ